MKLAELFPVQSPADTPDPESLIIVNLPRQEVSMTEKVVAMKMEALAKALKVVSVANPEQNNAAVDAQASLQRYIRAVDNAAEAVKRPLNAIRAGVIALNKELVAKADAEGNRIGKLVAEYQVKEQNRLAAERRLADQAATELEAERDRKLAKAQTTEEQDAIKQDFHEAVGTIPVPAASVRAVGQVVKQDWDVQVSDIWLLARAHPGCVKIEPRLAEIKALLNAGVKVAGVVGTRITKASVRIGAEPAAIEV